MAARVYIVLYTKQKTQKQKKWQDGTLRVTDTKVTLLDEQGKPLDSSFKRDVPTLEPGARIELESFLVDIERENTASAASTPSPAPSPAPPPPKPAAPFKRMRVDRMPQTENAQVQASAPPPSSATAEVTSESLPPINMTAKRSVADILSRFKKPSAAPAVAPAPAVRENVASPPPLPPPPAIPPSETDELDFAALEAASMELSSPSSSLQDLPAAVRSFSAPRSVVPPPSLANPRNTTPAAPKASVPPRGQFRPPQQRTPDVSGWQHNSFCFPNAETCIKLLKRGLIAPREVNVPDAFASWASYVTTMKSAVIEDMNLHLVKLSCLLRSLYCHLPSLGSGTSGVMCKHSRPAVHGIVRSEGVNKGKGYWACSERGPGSCKFWQWDEGSAVALEANAIGTLPTNHTITKMDVAYLRGSGVAFYADTVVFKNTSAPKRRDSEAPSNPKVTFYLRVNPESKEASSAYSKDDLWIISSSPDFTARTSDDVLFVARSVYHGPAKSGVMEIRPTGAMPRIAKEMPVFAIHGPEASSEVAMLDNLAHLLDYPPPLHRALLGNTAAATSSTPLSEQQAAFPHELLSQMIEETIDAHKLNEDQAAVLRSLSSWFRAPCTDPIRLVHGVFGAGKSHLLVVIILCLSRLFEECGSTLRILVAAGTNVAVDRVLLGLLKAGFTDFLRVGSLKKIAKPIYRLMCDMSSAKERIHELEKMLRSEELSEAEKALVRHELGEQRSERAKEREEKLGTVRVVGVTCAAASFALLDDKKFDIVLLDECSQIIEPLSLLPMRFACSRLLCVGDPLQLPPTIQHFTEGTGDDISKALFTRLSKVVPPIMLRTQYRCHPVLSKIANQLFYDSRLMDGASVMERPPLVRELPVLSFIEATSGHEQQLKTFGGSYANDYEAQVVAKLIRVLADSDVKAASIGVICLYRAQVTRVLEMLRRQFPDSMQSKRPQGTPAPVGDDGEALDEEALIEATEPSEAEAEQMLTDRGGDETLEASDFDARDVQVSTVDAFQGAEREIVIVTSSRTSQAGEGFLDSPQRLNVALTRARRHLLVVIMGAATEQNGRFAAADVLAADDVAELRLAKPSAPKQPPPVYATSAYPPSAARPTPSAALAPFATKPPAAPVAAPRPYHAAPRPAPFLVSAPAPRPAAPSLASPASHPPPPPAKLAPQTASHAAADTEHTRHSPSSPASPATAPSSAAPPKPAPSAAAAPPPLPAHLMADFEIEL